jgi:hypothetical protein
MSMKTKDRAEKPASEAGMSMKKNDLASNCGNIVEKKDG